ncbi:hypothetical protein POTOM_031397 [Populus tomentosa]|uniref:O-fucosyltransferase family protein n=1 Tax=Populus tomentosa TaxID=118781 RepID=A0A8X7Z9T9_POPTO|nr:hypothetical protein POTOM_031397 [Populus tomentosa]
MEVVRSESGVRSEKIAAPVAPVIARTKRLQVWFIRVCSSILLWTCLVQLLTVGELWHHSFINIIAPSVKHPPLPLLPLIKALTYRISQKSKSSFMDAIRIFLSISVTNLASMEFQICDMVAVTRLLNLTLVVPELDKTSFWADNSTFEDIFDVKHFIESLRDEIRIVRRLPKRFSSKYGYKAFEMPPILPLFSKQKVLHFNKTDARLANNGVSIDLQKVRCRVTFQALKFTPEIESLGYKLVRVLHERGPFVALHMRYEMDMLAFSGCTHGCTKEEAEELKQLRYAYPWWREKEIVSEERRSQGLCPLTPEETALILQALGFDKDTQIYIAAGEIFGSERRLAVLRAAYPRIVRKEMLLYSGELQQFQNHSSQMAALDFMVSIASDTFIPTYDGNMAKVVEGHRRYLGFKKTILLDRKRLVELLDLHQNGTLTWNEFVFAVRSAHEKRMGQPTRRRVIADKPKEEDYFYANPQECLCEGTSCDDLLGPGNSSSVP